MDILTIAIVVTTVIAGIATTSLLSGKLRLMAVAVVLLGPILVYGVMISPLPLHMHWTRDPGYDSASWVPVAAVVAIFAFVAAVVGLAVGQAGRVILRSKRSPKSTSF